jgi:hypothetical protein
MVPSPISFRRVLSSTARVTRDTLVTPNVSYALRGSAPRETIALDASAAADVQRVFWFDGGALIGVRRVADGAFRGAPRPPASTSFGSSTTTAERDVEVHFTK